MLELRPAPRYDLSQKLSADQLELLLENALMAGALDAARPCAIGYGRPLPRLAADQQTAAALEAIGGLKPGRTTPPAADRGPYLTLVRGHRELSRSLAAGNIGTITAILSAYQFGRACAAAGPELPGAGAAAAETIAAVSCN